MLQKFRSLWQPCPEVFYAWPTILKVGKGLGIRLDGLLTSLFMNLSIVELYL